MSRLRRHLSYPNVAASLALFLALGGAAWASHEVITASDITDDAVLARHIANGQVGASELAEDSVRADEVAPSATRSRAIADNALAASDLANGIVAGAKILEGSVSGDDVADDALTRLDLDGSVLRPEVEDGSEGSCNPGSASLITCSSRSLTLPAGATATAWILAAIAWHSDDNGAAGTCILEHNGISIEAVDVGENEFTTDVTHLNHAVAVEVIGLTPGLNELRLRCNQTEANINFPRAHLVAVAQ